MWKRFESIFHEKNKTHLIIFLSACVLVVLIGQAGRELFPPDDLREAEIAREMYQSGDFVIPHLAGLPFVEKPPGFSALIAMAYHLAGGPSAAAARAVSITFALASILSVFLLGRLIAGMEGGIMAACILAFSVRFCLTSHDVLLDNALTASIGFADLFTWAALSHHDPGRKRIYYALSGLSLGISFLFKGMVGITLFGSGLLVYLILTKRTVELRHMLRPLPVIFFLVPVLCWTIPFVIRAPSDLIKEFFISNHLGRFLSAYRSHHRPFFFYFLNIWPEFFPGSLVLPFAVQTAWKTRKSPDNQAGIFFLSLAAGPLMLLSLSMAKANVYLLPVYPALAILAAWFIMKTGSINAYIMRVVPWVTAASILVPVMIIIGMTGTIDGVKSPVILSVVVALLAAAGGAYSIRRKVFRDAGLYAAALIILGWSLWFSGPIAAADMKRDSLRDPMREVFSHAGNREILLYQPNDDLRGAAGFYRNRTALEIDSPEVLISRLLKDQGKCTALLYCKGEKSLPPELTEFARSSGANLHIETSARLGDKYLVLISEGTGTLERELSCQP